MTRSLYFLLFAVFVVLSACSSKNAANEGSKEEPLKPVKIMVYQQGGYFTEQDFNELIAEPVKNKYPHLTVEMGPVKWIGDLLMANEQVDFFVTWDGGMTPIGEFELFTDITPMAKKSKFDLGRFDQGALDAVRGVSATGQLHALPYAVNLNALYYNKDIFEKFGVAFPKDGMTWDETIELAKKIALKDNDVQYRGLEIDDLNRMLFPMSLNIVDVKTDKVMVNSDPYKTVFGLAKQMYSIPGNDYQPEAINRFIKERNLGMIATINLFLRLREAPELNWDIAQFPSYKERPNTYGMYDLHVMIPLNISKYPDDQMRVLEVLFSEEVQKVMVKKSGKISTLKDPIYAQLFGQDLPDLKGKSLASIFKSKPAPAPGYSKYYPKALAIVNEQFTIAMRNEKDINTALRDAEEYINQYIAGEKTQ